MIKLDALCADKFSEDIEVSEVLTYYKGVQNVTDQMQISS